MKLIQKRNSSNHIKELLTYHDDITTSTTTTTTNKENRVDSTHELSSSKIENQNSTTSNNDKIKYINDKNSSNKDYKKLNKDQSNVNDNTNKFINNTNNTYDVINNIKENKIKNINEIYNNGNRLTENTVDKNSNNMKNLVKMENINSSELDLLNKEINKHTKNNIFKTENNKTLIQEYNREKDSQTKSINVENENNNSRSSIDPFIKNDVNNMSKHEYDSNRKSLISKNIYYCKDKYNIDNKDEISNNESKVDQKEVLKNNSISSNTIYDYSLNSLPINEKNVPNQNILNTKKYTLNENEYYDHLNDDNSKVLEKEVDKMVKQKSSNKENFELKNEQSKRNIHESTKNINKNDNNVKPDLIKEVSNIKSSVDLGLEYKGNEDNFPEKNKYLQCIKDLKKKITEYKEIEKNYNQMILNMKKYQNHNKEDERLHISPSAVKLIMNYLHHYGYDRSVEFIRNETGIGANTKNYKILKQLINKREFEKAVNFTKEVYESKSNSENRFKSSYEDLLYILNKYLLLNYLQERKQDEATALFNNYICGHIKNEIDKGGSRAEWFNKDYKLLSTLININKSTEIEKINTFFNSWDWDKEIKQFWKNGFNAYKSSYNLTKGKLSQAPEEQTNIPLFAYVLAAYFLEEEDLMDDYDYQTSYKILDNINNFSKEIKNILNKDYSKFDDENKITEKSTVGSCIPTSTKNEPRITVSNNSEDNNSNLTHCESSNNIYTIATGKRRIKSAGIFRSTGNLSSNYSLLNERKIHSSHSTQSLNKKKSQSMINGIYDPIESQNEKQGIINSNQFKGFVLTNDMMKPDFGTSRLLRTPDSTNSYQNPYIDNEMLPSVSNENETSYFTFFSCLGPMMGTIRALDIKSIPSTKQVIGVSACGDDRGDRKISLWDLNSSSLITQLDNKTSKTVLTLTFHPVWEEVLLSSDMEFDVKLWNWKTGKLLKVWKKHHTRIIHKAGFIPGNFEKAISCSSDQSIKIWNVTNDDSKVSSIHSNEPFTSFTFWGDGHNQVLVASLNYSIKLYKLRTSSHLHTIALNDLKSNRTPITSITSHPIQDNFILISSDNKLLLFDLRTSTTLKTFCAREIIPGLRIQGDFSPCGNYIYSGCADVKSFDSRKNSLLSSNSMSISYSNLNNGEDQIESSINKINTTGIFIWKLHTGKLERNDMSIMEESTIYSNVELYPVTLCKWISLNNDNKEENRNKKVLISASIDRCLKIYSG
ncbi:WD40 repeat-like protein [Piromyces finnis]|uniref:WD40 repeat-like protein n=1 Tax=Piromyces finnis TaxID=1754191 RepID=A0A1Y1VBN1_9FUNG|nr:WD40 repeat-like protein [Piromyces finnis]|eukprot:ORX52099.1 WD40 repeat-like protein [Piromyces finnis]